MKKSFGRKKIYRLFLLTLFISISNFSHADALADLQRALSTLKGEHPLTASLSVSNWHKQGKGKGAVETTGAARVTLHDDATGLQIIYNKSLLEIMEREAQSKNKDPDLNTPTLNAIDEFKVTDLSAIMSSASSLLRVINEADFTGEEEGTYKGRKARIVNFSMSIDTLNKRDRKYIKKFKHTFKIWIDDGGYPIASQRSILASGRAMVVIRFTSKTEVTTEYAVEGDRLVRLYQSSVASGTGGGEESETRATKRLEIET